MTESRTIIRVFLASPGDLAEERRAALSAVEEVNRTTAIPQGFHIELYGWEDTVSAAGRPQAIINEELKQCELFVGMLWRRWGTPPDQSGVYTSGFEEEFELANALRESRQHPEIKMYFKDVEASRLADPGSELSKVIHFKKRLIDEKRILFDSFSDASEFSRKVRIALADYVNKKRLARRNDLQETETPETTDRQIERPEVDITDIGPRAQTVFLQLVARKLHDPDPFVAVPAGHVARLRLAAMSHHRPGNDEPEMGPHDTNMLYRERRSFDLELSEVRTLASFGLAAFHSENKPLWLWLSISTQNHPNWLLISTWSTRTSERKGAFAIAALAEIDILSSDLVSREEIVSFWLDRDDKDAVKEALEYLKFFGIPDDLNIIDKGIADRSSPIFRHFLETKLAIVTRFDPSSSGQIIIDFPFDEIDTHVLREALCSFTRLSDEEIARAIEHRSPKVRERGLQELHHRGRASLELGKRFADDPDLAVRQIALAIIEGYEGSLSLAEIKKIIVKPKPDGLGTVLGIGSLSGDRRGQQAFEMERLERLAKRPDKQLKQIIDNADSDSDIAFFALAKRNFKSMESELRANFDDRFKQFFQKDVRRLEASIGTSERALALLEKVKAGEDWQRKKYMNLAFAILLAKNEPQDLRRFRSAIDDDAVVCNKEAFTYFSKFGEWSDILRIANFSKKVEYPFLTLHSYLEDGARAISVISRRRLPELLKLPLDNTILEKVLKLASAGDFSALTDEQILSLLMSDSDEVRRVVSLQIVSCIKANRARSIFDTHISGERYFYNVVHWLDLLVAFSAPKARRIAKRALSRGRLPSSAF